MPLLKRILILLLPPIIFYAPARIQRWRREHDPDFLFDGDDQLYKENIATCRIYVEYGCGKSTVWAANNTQAKIYGVETSLEWANRVKDNIPSDKCEIHYVDVGDVGDYGRPLSYEKPKSFLDYANWLWEQNIEPDLVLIDGRFRVLCFLTTLKNARQGTRIIFDDYLHRRHYFIVEKYLKPTQVTTRQALFTVPEKDQLNLSVIEQDITKFHYVMD